MAHCVLEHVADRAPELTRVAPDLGRGQRRAHGDAVGRRERGALGRDHRIEVEQLVTIGQAARVAARQQEEVVGEVLERDGLVEEAVPGRGRVGGVGMGIVDLELGPHPGERRAQLVRRVGHEPLLGRGRALDPAEQPPDDEPDDEGQQHRDDRDAEQQGPGDHLGALVDVVEAAADEDGDRAVRGRDPLADHPVVARLERHVVHGAGAVEGPPAGEEMVTPEVRRLRDDRAVLVEHLGDDVRAPQLGDRAGPAALQVGGDLGHALHVGLVDAVDELGVLDPHQDEAGADEHDDDRERRGRGHPEPGGREQAPRDPRDGPVRHSEPRGGSRRRARS